MMLCLPLKKHLNVVSSTMDAPTSLSCTLPLPNSIGSISNFLAINIEAQEDPILLFFGYTRLSDNYEDIDTYVAVNPPVGFVFFSNNNNNNNNNSVVVYKAAVTIKTTVQSYQCSTWIKEAYTYAVKVVEDDNPESILMLKEQVSRSFNSEEDYEICGTNLLGIVSAFEEEQYKKYCVVVDSHIPGGSIRAIMEKNSGGGGGLSEDLILCVLRSVLNALKFLHQRRIMHRDINAGHVYLCNNAHYHDRNRPLIKLGFEASVYEVVNEIEGENTTYLPMISMSKWAAAPEVYYNDDKNQSYTEKADIWLVGILALELAYGGLKVSNRNALEAMTKDIKFPPNSENPNSNAAMMLINSYITKLLSPLSSFSSKSNVNVDDDKELRLPLLSSSDHEDSHCCPVSESFTDMVMQCLVWDPEKRPSVDKLMSHPFFTTSNLDPEKDGQYFYDALIKKTSSSS